MKTSVRGRFYFILLSCVQHPLLRPILRIAIRNALLLKSSWYWFDLFLLWFIKWWIFPLHKEIKTSFDPLCYSEKPCRRSSCGVFAFPISISMHMFKKNLVLSRSVFSLLMTNTLLLSADGISKTHVGENTSIPVKEKKIQDVGLLSKNYPTWLRKPLSLCSWEI